jgi:branched-chain amino acid transport system permease protein
MSINSTLSQPSANRARVGVAPSSRNVLWVILLILAACALPFILSNYQVFQLTLALAYSIAILGLNMVTGYNGQISLGHGAFYAVGA